ncbi:MAG: hypothetical protein JSS27_18490 [Planctomycetes bacterium]|nr:hypothetical protein [Planctomycetota bacterium]
MILHDDETVALVTQIHDAGHQGVLAVTGGGSAALAALLAQPGASRTVLEAVVPYAAEALTAWLGARPEQFCSVRTACAMAMASYQRARAYRPDEESHHLFGVGATASLASDRPKHGSHRVHVAVQTAGATRCTSHELNKGARSRGEEEAFVCQLILNLVAETCGVDARLKLALLAGDATMLQQAKAPPAWEDLLAGRVPSVAVGHVAAGVPAAIFPGAFNPLHDGHRQMATIAARRLGTVPAFELSVTNVDKPALDYLEIERRVSQFGADDAVWLTCAPTFVEKSGLFPGATFVVGADTIERIAAPRYYGNDQAATDRALATLAQRRCRFLVFGRTCEGRFQGLDELRLPQALRALCIGVPESDFRNDVSSTELRGGARG